MTLKKLLEVVTHLSDKLGEDTEVVLANPESPYLDRTLKLTFIKVVRPEDKITKDAFGSPYVAIGSEEVNKVV